jgi:hypothetical protein
VAPTAIDVYRQSITMWSERLRFHLLQLKAKSGANTGAEDAASTQQLISEVVQALEQIQREVWAEVNSLHQRYQHEIDEAPFWRRAFLQRKQTSEEANYREVTQLIEQVLLAAANIRDTMSLAGTNVQPTSQSDIDEVSEPELEPVTKPSPDYTPADLSPTDLADAAPADLPILQQELRRVADQWKWRLDTTRGLLETPNLSPERIAYIRGIQTTAWNVLQDIAALLDDESLTS